MMINDLWLTNFRNHRKFHIKLEPGITGIVGNTGSGKSSIVEAILFLLTGELFEGDKKQDAITLGEDTGKVTGTFTLNGKEGWIERHLDISKTVLKYDGVVYKKATEVKELWDKLMQISPDIIKQVLIAQQGNLSLLFSGDNSIREKIFQKIFMVPPTDRIRNIIWQDYLKQAPPLIPEEDELTLNDRKEVLERDITNIQEHLKELKVIPEVEIHLLRDKLTHLRKCIDDAGKKSILESEFTEIKDKVEVEGKKLKDIEDTLKLVNINQFTSTRNILLQNKRIYQQKQKLENDLNGLQYPFSVNDLEEYMGLEDTRSRDMSDAMSKLSVVSNTVETLRNELQHISKLVDHVRCPTCGQQLDDMDKYIASLKESLNQAIIEKDNQQCTCDELKQQGIELNELINSYNQIKSSEKLLRKQIEPLQDVMFDEQQLIESEEVIERYSYWEAEEKKITAVYNTAKHHKQTIHNELCALAHYVGYDTPELEMTEIAQIMAQNTDNIRIRQSEEIRMKVMEAELSNLTERLRQNETNKDKNKARNKYIDVLNKAYDILHTSQFPRKLILNYADIMTEYLQDNLSLFHIPYKARVADNFKIEMIDDEDRVLPKVSGGQEVQVGLSLHLALHDLFSQSFPLMVIDEGTTHQDTRNRKAYFDIIKGLKAKNKFKQIIIIDHDPALIEVVDHVIELESND